MEKKIAVILGDGIGPEVTRQSIRVLDTVAEQFGHRFEYGYGLMGADAIDKTGNPLPDETIELCLNSDAILFGAIGHPKYDNDPTAKVRPEQGLLKLRKSLQLFANIRPVATYPSLQHLAPLKPQHLEGVDFIIFRELTGGIYFGKKETNAEHTEASDLCSYTRDEIKRISRLAFQYAQQRRKKLTLVDKANVLETSRLWRKVVQEIAERHLQEGVKQYNAGGGRCVVMVGRCNNDRFQISLLQQLPIVRIRLRGSVSSRRGTQTIRVDVAKCDDVFG